MNKTYMAIKPVNETQFTARLNPVNAIEQFTGIKIINSRQVDLKIADNQTINISAYESIKGDLYVDYELYHRFFTESNPV